MAAIDDLIAQIEDRTLRERLRAETGRITRRKRFGLVFEGHLPELIPAYGAKVRKHSKVAPRGGPLTDLWRVLSVRGAKAQCQNISRDETRQIPVDELVVVRQFGEPVFPALNPVDQVQNGSTDDAWHTLIEADNYHALQLLEYLEAGNVDCIYIDPPYNTGARDWKYNNDYVDDNDNWRHSKWLAFIRRRLRLAKRLLNPHDSMLIVTIDEKECVRLGMLLEEVFPEARIQMVSTLINPAAVARGGYFGRSDEYCFFVMLGRAGVKPLSLRDDWVTAKGRTHRGHIRWDLLRKSGSSPTRTGHAETFYAFFVSKDGRRIHSIGEPIGVGTSRHEVVPPDGTAAVWPIRRNGTEGRWRLKPESARQILEEGCIRVGRFKGETTPIYYLATGERAKIHSGIYEVVGHREDGSVTTTALQVSQRVTVPGTQWRIGLHDATQYGTRLLLKILPDQQFPYPKSVYAVRDAIRFCVGEKPNALVVDFFSGSGTTLTAVDLLNSVDKGRRRCIMITNNEVSEQDAIALTAVGYRQGDAEWERHGICQEVSWPRSKYTILGKRDDGSALAGDYVTGQTTAKAKRRRVQQVAFVESGALDTASKKKQLASLIDGIPQSKVQKSSAFVVSEQHPASILFDETRADEWFEALINHPHVTDLYIVTSSGATFEELRKRIHEVLGPVFVVEEEKRPMREGFPVNLEYFRLVFLEKDHVALGRQFREILPLLWLRAGAVGPRPVLPRNRPIPTMVVPEGNRFAVLVDEAKFADFGDEIERRDNLTHAFLVTNSEEAFQEMAGRLSVPNVVQLYRDYLDNFVINKGEDVQ